MGITIRTNPGPYQVVFVTMAMVAGMILVLRGRAVGIHVEQPQWISYLLAGSLIAGSAVTLAGIATPNLLGALLERAGQWMLVVLLTGYSGVIIALEGTQATVTVVFFAAYVLSGLWRILQIQRLVRHVTETVQGQARREDRA